MTRWRQIAPLLKASIRGRGEDLRLWAVWSAVEAVPAFFSGRFMALAIDHGFLRGRVGSGLAYLAGLAATAALGAWGTRQAFTRLAAIVEPFRDELVELAVAGSLRRREGSAGDADMGGVARLTQQVEIVREAYASVLMVAQSFVVTSVAALLGLLTLLPAALPLVVGPLLLGVLVFVAALGWMANVQHASIMADEWISQSAGGICGGLRDVAACGGEEAAAGILAASIAEQARATTELARVTAIRSLALALGGLLPIALILLRAPALVRDGASTGAIIGALTYVLQGVQPVLQTFVRSLGSTGLWLGVALQRIVEVAEAAPASARARTVRLRPWVQMLPGPYRFGLPGATDPHGHDLVLRELTFGYGGESEPVIAGLDLVVPETEHLAVVGPSGAGKSTLAGLIAGLLEPQRGDVLLGGVPVAELGARLARHRVLIPQEAYIFAGTVWENLSYLRPDAPPAALDHAIDRLGARGLVTRLGGLAAELDPHALSAGERQLLTLVRSYVSPAKLVILDEATCHLDPASEATVERAFAQRGGSLMVIAHRISSALRAQRVLVLDGGKALVGSHDELLERSSLYRDLVGHWESQPPSWQSATNGAAIKRRGRLLERIGHTLSGHSS